MNPHLWALVLSLVMFSGSLVLAAVSVQGMIVTPFEGPWHAGAKWRGHAERLFLALAVFLAAFAPLAVWFHYNPCIAGCR